MTATARKQRVSVTVFEEAVADARHWKTEARKAQALNQELLAALKAIKEAANDLPKCKSRIPRDRYASDIARWAEAAIAKAEGRG
jgi:hypothetical protein